MNDERFNSNLREALRLMTEESAPSAGWERRVLEESFGKPHRIWVRLSVAAISAAAVALALLILAKPEPTAIAPVAAEPGLLIAQAPAPYVHIEPVRPEHHHKAIKPVAPQPIVILPEPLADADMPKMEEPLPEIAVNEYIDELLAQSLTEEQELISSILDPEFNASYTPLQ